MKRLVKVVLIGAAVLIAIVVAVLLIFREDLSQMALGSTLEYAEEQVVQHLPADETIEGVRSDFEALRKKLDQGAVSADDLKPLLDEFVAAFEDRQVSTEEVKQILTKVRDLLKR